MVTVRLPYGKEEIQFNVAKERISAILLPKYVSGSSDAYGIVRQALQNPMESPGLSSIVKKGSVTIITDDFTRPTPAGVICRAIIDKLMEHGIEESQVTILAAGGLHRPMTQNEMRAKFGDELMKRIEIKTHDAWDQRELEYLGQTTRGTPVWINRSVANASLRVTVGMITAHFVAGYGS